MTLPNFIVIGAPRCGTTSLHYALSRHPSIFLPVHKEVDFFMRGQAGELPPWGQRRDHEIPRNLGDYAALFDKAPTGAVVGDISPSYLWEPVAGRIHAALPMARIICLLRHPVDQARSILATWSGGRQPSEDELAARLASDEHGPRGLWPLRMHGQYGSFLEPYFDLFPKQILVVMFEEMTRLPDETLLRIQQHIRVKPRKLKLPHFNASAMRPSGPSAWKTWLKRSLPAPVVRRLARTMHQARGYPLYDATLSTAFKREMVERHYGRTMRQLRGLGVEVDAWWDVADDDAAPQEAAVARNKA